MGFFKRGNTDERLDITPVESSIVVEPTVTTGELERMVHTTYEEKLALERQLEEANEKVAILEDVETKLRAAELFSHQCELERDNARTKIEDLQEREKQLEKQLKEERAKVTTRDIKIRELTEGEAELKRHHEHDLIEALKRAVDTLSGNWSKQRVIDFLDGFLVDTSYEELDTELVGIEEE